MEEIDVKLRRHCGPLGLVSRTIRWLPLGRNLKRERIAHDLADAEKHCATCQQVPRPIGEESKESYEYTPAQSDGQRSPFSA